MALKKFLMAMALSSFALCAEAQNYVPVYSDLAGIVPMEVLDEDENLLWNASERTRNRSITILSRDLNVLKTIRESSAWEIFPVCYNDSYRENYFMPVTQDIFDEDSQFEYIAVSSNYDYDFGNGITSFSIKKENGAILKTISFGDGYYLKMADTKNEGFPIAIVNAGSGKYLLRVMLVDKNKNSDDEQKYLIRYYSFKKGTIATSIKNVRDIPQMRVHPTFPQKDETIKVDLSGVSSPSKLSVVDTNGKVCFMQPVPTDQKSVELSTSGMPAGMYIVRVTDGKKEVENCRVIIR